MIISDFVQILDQKVEQKFTDKKSELATKEDLHQFRVESKDDISALRAELLRTIFLSSLGQHVAIVVSVVGLLLVLLRH